MARELIGGYPAANDREQMGLLLRYAFPLGLGSFTVMLSKLRNEERVKTSLLQEAPLGLE